MFIFFFQKQRFFKWSTFGSREFFGTLPSGILPLFMKKPSYLKRKNEPTVMEMVSKNREKIWKRL